MTQNQLRTLIDEAGKRNKERMSSHDKILSIAYILGEGKRNFNFGSTALKGAILSDIAQTIFEFYYDYSEPIKMGYVFEKFVSDRNHYAKFQQSDITHSFFHIGKLLFDLPSFHFKEENIGAILGTIFGYADSIGINLEEELAKRLNMEVV